jgi:adenylate cyclase
LPVTVVFTDLRNFTTVSESLTPAALLAWINRGMACCVPAITRRNGMVNTFTGDGMMAVFGAPLSAGTQQDARDALASLLEIRAGMEALNLQLAAEGAPAMRMRLGVHSGMVLAGSMGSSERLEYAVIGDAVNCASRIEGLEKDRHDGLCRILVSGHTFALLDPEGRSDDGLVWERWGEFQVKGRQEPLEIWELREGPASGGGDPAVVPG